MKVIRRITGMVLSVFLVTGMSAIADIPNKTMVIGNRGYSLKYINDKSNHSEIQRYLNEAVRKQQGIFIKDGRGQWFDRSNSSRISEDRLPPVVYQKKKGIYRFFEEGDGDKIEIGNFFENDGTRIFEIHTDEDIFIKEKEIYFKNSTIDGTMFIDTGEGGKVTLNSVEVNRIKVLASGVQKIELFDVKADEFIIDGMSEVSVIIKGGTSLKHTSIKSNTILEKIRGSYGEIEVDMSDKSRDKSLQLKSSFDERIIIKSGMEVTVPKIYGIQSLEIEPRESNEKITLNGKINEIKVNSESEIYLKGAKITVVEAESKLKLDIDENSIVRKIKDKENKVIIQRGKDRIGYNLKDDFSN